MKISDYAVKNYQFTLVIFLVIIALGVTTILNMPRSEDPEHNPSRYSKTASLSISNIITPYLLQIAEDGGIESAVRMNKGLKNGVYLYHGILTNKSIGDCLIFLIAISI